MTGKHPSASPGDSPPQQTSLRPSCTRAGHISSPRVVLSVRVRVCVHHPHCLKRTASPAAQSHAGSPLHSDNNSDARKTTVFLPGRKREDGRTQGCNVRGATVQRGGRDQVRESEAPRTDALVTRSQCARRGLGHLPQPPPTPRWKRDAGASLRLGLGGGKSQAQTCL